LPRSSIHRSQGHPAEANRSSAANSPERVRQGYIRRDERRPEQQQCWRRVGFQPSGTRTYARGEPPADAAWHRPLSASSHHRGAYRRRRLHPNPPASRTTKTMMMMIHSMRESYPHHRRSNAHSDRSDATQASASTPGFCETVAFESLGTGRRHDTSGFWPAFVRRLRRGASTGKQPPRLIGMSWKITCITSM
jgi:hypothetical protein